MAAGESFADELGRLLADVLDRGRRDAVAGCRAEARGDVAAIVVLLAQRGVELVPWQHEVLVDMLAAHRLAARRVCRA